MSKANSIPDCECVGWATDSVQARLLGNGHNPRCPQYQPHVTAIELLGDLLRGIEYWASQEDGVPDELWDAYGHAHYIVRGSLPVERERI